MRTCGPGVSTRPIERWSPTYHEAGLGKLVEPSPKPSTASAPAQHDAFDVDEVLHQYQRAAREL